MKNYSTVLTGLVFSMHSRRFIASLAGSALAWLGWRYNIPNEVLATMAAPLVAFILGESIADAAERRGAGTVNVGSAENVSSGQQSPEVRPDWVDANGDGINDLDPLSPENLIDEGAAG